MDLFGRVVLAVGIGAFAGASGGFSLAQVMRKQAPETAQKLAPYDSHVLSTVAERRLAAGDAAQMRRAENLAKRALRRDPTNVSAVATLGLAAMARNDLSSARSLFVYSQELSRRDVRTQLWAIEDSVSRGDIKGALRHYDIALRTSSLTPEILFPVLAGAIADVRIREETARTLASRPVWGQTFVRQIASHGPDFSAVNDLFLGLRRAHYPFPEGAHASLIAGLISENAFDRAWSYYAAIHPGVKINASRDPTFGATTNVPSAFDWNLVQNDDITSAIQAGQDSSVYTFGVSPGQGGVLLRQLQMLPAGRYRIEGKSLGSFGSGNAAPYWSLICLDGSELGRVAISSGDNPRAYAGNITVPAGCPIQWFSLVARPSPSIGGQSGEVVRVALRPDLG